jgi:anti-sigma regulatory factor (Ser/Thr protein kinase)
MNDRWPLQDFLELGALVSAVPCARLHARQVLWEWGIGNLGDSAELLVTELITNAVTASRETGRDSAVRLWLLSDSAQILILVWDASPRPPVLTDASDEAEHGRGLMLVDAVSEQWGWYSREASDGKFVWAITRLCIPGASHPRADNGRHNAGQGGSLSSLPGSRSGRWPPPVARRTRTSAGSSGTPNRAASASRIRWGGLPEGGRLELGGVEDHLGIHAGHANPGR